MVLERSGSSRGIDGKRWFVRGASVGWVLPLGALILTGCGLSAAPQHPGVAKSPSTSSSPAASGTLVVQATRVSSAQTTPVYRVPPGTYVIGVTVGTRNPQSSVHGLRYRLINVVVGKHSATFNGSVINDTGQPLSWVSGVSGRHAYFLTSQQEQVDPLRVHGHRETSKSFGYNGGDIVTPSNWTTGAAVFGWTRFPVPITPTITFRQPPFKPITIRFGP